MRLDSTDSVKQLPVDPKNDSGQVSRRLLDAGDQSFPSGGSKIISRDAIQKTAEPAVTSLPQYEPSKTLSPQGQDNPPIHHLGLFEAPLGTLIAGSTIGVGSRLGVPKLYESSPWLAEKTVASALAVTAESLLQSKAAQYLGDHGHTTLGRIAEPNMAGAMGKGAALILGATLKERAAYLGVAEAIELETNMTTGERIASTAIGMGATAAAFLIGGRKLAAPLAIANVGIFAASTAASWGLYDDLNLSKQHKTLDADRKVHTDSEMW